MKGWLVAGVIALSAIALIEVSLRQWLGLGNPLLYLADREIGYRLAPNQEVHRFGNRIAINQYSMRGAAIEEKRPPNTFRLLLLGDSIANGGWWTDQSETISALMERQLSNPLPPHTQGKTIEVLNASANSWGPRNQRAYLQKFGTFSAQVIVLLLNTDDLFAIAPTSLPVGRDINYPSHKPPFALVELFNRLLLRPKPIPEMAVLNQEKGDRVGINLAAIEEISEMAKAANAQFLLVMTPLQREVDGTDSRNYEEKARLRLQNFAETKQISYLDFLPPFKQEKDPNSLYRDHIHLSPQGNQLVSETISKFVERQASY